MPDKVEGPACPWCCATGDRLDVSISGVRSWKYCRACGASGPDVRNSPKPREDAEKAWASLGVFKPLPPTKIEKDKKP
jgi:hypothetical protein